MSNYNFSDLNQQIQEIVSNTFYRGSQKKGAVIMNDGQSYMMKFPQPIKHKDGTVSYLNNTIAEYIGCHIFASVGIPVQDTYLGRYVRRSGKEQTVCLCRSFRNDGISLCEAHQYELFMYEISFWTSLQSVKTLIANLHDIDPKKVFEQYCDRLIIDAYIGNFSRTNKDWGVALHNDGTVDMAPVFDCASSFAPFVDHYDLTDEEERNEALNVRSALYDPNTNRQLYYSDILFSNDPDIAAALQRMVPAIDPVKTWEIISQIPYISEQQKRFYYDLTEIRYTEQLLPALERVRNTY